jgi:hypothetical protein
MTRRRSGRLSSPTNASAFDQQAAIHVIAALAATKAENSHPTCA